MSIHIDFSTTSPLRALALLALLVLPAAVCTAADVYTLPKTWNGTKQMSTDGNPALVDGAPMWRLDAVVNPRQKEDAGNRPDAGEPQHYRPLIWKGDAWRYDLPQYRETRVTDGDFASAEMGCDGTGEFSKNNALVFITPKDGRYALAATIDVANWEGSAGFSLTLYIKEVRKGAARFLRVQGQGLEIKKGMAFKSDGIDLPQGAELIILPAIHGYNCGGTVDLKGLRITREDLPGGYRETLGPSREPASRTKEPMAKGDPTGFNFPLCSEPVNTAQRKDGSYDPGLHDGHQCMGVIDITKPPYNADNTGKTDVSDILTRALQDNPANSWSTRIIYLPDGVYLVSKTVKTRGQGSVGPCLQGQSRKGTIIRLKDGTWTTKDKDRHWVLWTGDGAAQCFNRILRNFTVSIGKDNDGASGMWFYAHNQGSMSDIDIISEDGKGQVGLDMGDSVEQGPCLVQNTQVKGFRIGVHSDALNAVTFKNLGLEGQSEVGFLSSRHEQWIDGLTSINRVPAVDMREGAMVIIDAKLTGGDAAVPAIKHQRGMLFVRNLTASGYGKAIESTAKDMSLPTGLTIDEYSGKGSSLFGPPQRSLNLPVKATPEPKWEQDMTKWANVEWYKRKGMTDAEALQAAIDDKRNTTLCVPVDVRINGLETVFVRGNISRIIGTGGRLTGCGKLVVSDEGPAVVKIERIGLDPECYHRSGRTLVIEAATGSWLRHEGTGDMFVTDTSLNLEVNNPKAHLWMWHFNSEVTPDGLTMKAGTARVFGWKTEGTSGNRGGRVLATGGTLEILGFLNYTSGGNQQQRPLFDIRDTEFSIASVAQFTFGNWEKELPHRLVREVKDGVTKEQPGTWMDLYTSWGNQGKDTPAVKP